ncbi:hypothetical protein G6F54_014386 [Rhizopus delemar]|nr:hypothetical protein G6F54_014386 [Rhizopus delemar]
MGPLGGVIGSQAWDQSGQKAISKAHESLAMRCGGDAGAGGDAGVGGDEDAAGGMEAPGYDLQWCAGL